MAHSLLRLRSICKEMWCPTWATKTTRRDMIRFSVKILLENMYRVWKYLEFRLCRILPAISFYIINSIKFKFQWKRTIISKETTSTIYASALTMLSCLVACLASRLRLLQRSQVGYTTVSIAFVTFVAPCQLRRTHCLRTIFHWW